MADDISSSPTSKPAINQDKLSQKRNNNNNKTSLNYAVRKRCPPHATRRKNDIYVTSSSNFKGQHMQCRKLIEEGEKELIIHGLGAALPQAINLALQLQELLHDTFDISTATDTVDVIDDLESLTDDLDSDTRVRPNSCIHIKLSRKV